MQPKVKLAVNQRARYFPKARRSPMTRARLTLSNSLLKSSARHPLSVPAQPIRSHTSLTLCSINGVEKKGTLALLAPQSQGNRYFLFLLFYFGYSPLSYINLRNNRRSPTAAVSFRLHLTISLSRPVCTRLSLGPRDTSPSRLSGATPPKIRSKAQRLFIFYRV